MMGDHIIFFGGGNRGYEPSGDLFILDLSPSLKSLCKAAVLEYGLQQSELPHNIRWELAAIEGDKKRPYHKHLLYCGKRLCVQGKTKEKSMKDI